MDVRSLSAEDANSMGRFSAKYGMNEGDFIASVQYVSVFYFPTILCSCQTASIFSYMWEDKEEQDQLEELRNLEEAKAALSVRPSSVRNFAREIRS